MDRREVTDLPRAFYEPTGADGVYESTQLTVRVRADYEPGPKMALMLPAVAMAHELMERRQLHNLRRRAEARPAT